MTSFPALSYVCPMPWTEMRGDERERFCARCSRQVVNLSLLTAAQRAELLARTPPEELCIAYYRRLNGEFVTAERPLTRAESSRVVQYGIATLSLSALAAIASSVPGGSDAIRQVPAEIVDACVDASEAMEERTREWVDRLTAAPPPAPPPTSVLILGAMACPPPAATPPPPPAPPPPALPPPPAPTLHS